MAMKPNPAPACRDLLDAKLRRELKAFSNFGYVGVLICEVLAYIELLEEELARQEMERPCSS